MTIGYDDSHMTPQKTIHQMVEIEFRYSDNSQELKTTLPLFEMLKVLHTGLLNNRSVDQVKLFEVENSAVIYSIITAKSGGNPWLELQLSAL